MSVDKLVDSTQLDADLTSVADAIREKGGTSADLAFPNDFVSAIGDIETGGGGYEEPEPLDVDFIDYDGTLLYTYTADDFLALTALPNNPTHDGLIAQGWNWSLADAKEYVGKYGSLVVGQNYITDDNKTRVYISLGALDTGINKSVTVQFRAVDSATITVDWGDETATDTQRGTDTIIFQHTYVEYGDYIVSIDVDCEGDCLLGYWGSNQTFFSDYCVRKVEIGANITGVMSKCFRQMRVLKSISIPTTCIKYAPYNEGNGSIFQDNYELQGLVIPSGCTELGMTNQNFITTAVNMPLKYLSFPKTMTSIGERASFDGMVKLRKLTLPELITNNTSVNFFTTLYNVTHLVIPVQSTTIGGITFTYINRVRKLIIPESITEINGSYGFAFPYAMQELRCLPTTPPTLAHARFIAYLPSDCIIYVPYSEDHSILEAYQTATNWATGASKMREVEP